MIRKFPTKSRCPSCDPHAKGQLGRMGAERKTKKSPKCQLCKGKLLIPVRIAQKYLAVMNGEEVETTFESCCVQADKDSARIPS